MGAKVVVVCECGHSIQGKSVPVFENKPVFDSQQWQSMIFGLHKIGDLARHYDMRLVYHHHMGTGVQTQEEIDRLMNDTDPELVSLIFDTGHIVYSGGDPVALVKKHGQRIKHVHLKDIRKNVLQRVKSKKMSFLDSVVAGVFTVPGDGFIDYDAIFQALAEFNYTGWFIVEAEQDPAKANPLDYAKMGRAFIQEKLGL